MTGRSLAVRCACGFGIGIFLGVFSLHVLGGDEAATPLPCYKLEVGQQIQYAGTGEDTYQNGRKRHMEGNFEFDVLGRNADGSFRLLFRMSGTSTEIDKDGKEDRSEEPETAALLDMDETGRMTEVFGSFGYRSSPAMDFPLLPVDAKEMANGWQGPEALGSTMDYQALPESTAKEFVLSIDEKNSFKIIYDEENTRTITFDYERGLPTKYKSTNRQGWGFKSEGSSEFKLTGVQMHDADWATKLQADAELFFSTKERFSRATDDDKSTPELLDEAVSKLKQTREKISSVELQQQIDREIESFEQYRKYSEEQLANRNAMIGRTAEDFKTTDLDGKPQALTDYRGKVVVLDFWYRGCGWCMRAMPALEKLSEHYRDAPVVVLGMNTDQNIEDAKFVVEKMGLKYATLKAEGLPEKFKVRGFPTFIVIGPTGVIREICPGWKATLEHDLEEKIDKLLAEAK